MNIKSILCLLIYSSFISIINLHSQYSYILTEDSPINDVQIGTVMTPALADIDDDGDLDLFLGQNSSNDMLFFRNTGNAEMAVYEQQFEENNPLHEYFNNSGCNSPTFIDIDNDEDLDLVAGIWTGTFRYMKNEGTKISPVFIQYFSGDNPLNEIKTDGICSYPAFVDIDDDEDFDLFISDNEGNIEFYRNEGDITDPEFSRDSINNPFKELEFETRVKLAFQDLNNDQKLDAVISIDVENPVLLYYVNEGTSNSPVFTQQSGANNPFSGITELAPLTPLFADIDNDDDQDLILGASRQILQYTATDISSSLKKIADNKNYKLYPNPTTGKITIESNSRNNYELYSSSGRFINGGSLRAGFSQIDLSAHVNGVYYLRIITEKEVFTQKLVLQ